MRIVKLLEPDQFEQLGAVVELGQGLPDLRIIWIYSLVFVFQGVLNDILLYFLNQRYRRLELLFILTLLLIEAL